MFGDVRAAIGAGARGGSLSPLASPAGAGIGALSGALLGRLAESLDKPGRAVRGLLAGRPEEALAFLPFSDTLGITDQENQVSGMELLGLQEDPGVAEQTLGTIAEMATDPLTYLGMFGGSKIGSGIKGALRSESERAFAGNAGINQMAKFADEAVAAQRAANVAPKSNPLLEGLGQRMNPTNMREAIMRMERGAQGQLDNAILDSVMSPLGGGADMRSLLMQMERAAPVAKASPLMDVSPEVAMFRKLREGVFQ